MFVRRNFCKHCQTWSDSFGKPGVYVRHQEAFVRSLACQVVHADLGASFFDPFLKRDRAFHLTILSSLFRESAETARNRNRSPPSAFPLVIAGPLILGVLEGELKHG